MARDILIYRQKYRKLGGLGTTLCSQRLFCSLKSFERDIDSATEALALRNALALGFTSLMLDIEYFLSPALLSILMLQTRWDSLIAEGLKGLCRILQFLGNLYS